MVCYKPILALFKVLPSGKKELNFKVPVSLSKCFQQGLPMKCENTIQLPCGQCVGCRLERSRQWALRCQHEASLHEKNCFITLTYNDENLPLDGSLDVRHFQLFMKRLREKFGEDRIRFFHCGEYGERFKRPHYHAILFGFDFDDKEYFKSNQGNHVFTSKTLDSLWGKGFCTIGSVTFESCAYVARYVTKKVNGKFKDEHYVDRGKGNLLKPEYCTMSRRPGIAYDWYQRFKSDVFPSDSVVVRGKECLPPRYYSNIYEVEDPEGFAELKAKREANAKKSSFDNSVPRLAVREKVQNARFKKLLRPFEQEVCL